MSKRKRHAPAAHASAAAIDASRRPRYFVIVGAALIAFASCIVYFPALRGGFLMDDDILLTTNWLVKSSTGLHSIWLTTEPFEYYPISYSSFWLEWRLWGRNAAGYHVSNLVLHIAAALLIWAVLRKLAPACAFLAALLFAVHPLNVESVGWIAQRRNVLAMVFFLSSILWFLCAEGGRGADSERDGRAERTNRIWYCLSVLGFLLAMLSKGSVAILPVVLLLIIWWQRDRITLNDWLRTVPFFVIAGGLTGVNIWFQTHGAEVVIRDANYLERMAGAGAAIWFYLSKALLPIELIFVYPQWHIRVSDLLWWLPAAAVGVLTTTLLWIRNTSPRYWYRSLVLGWIFFCVALLPVMGFVDVGFMQYSLVADHYAHIALIGVVTLVAAALTWWQQQSKGMACYAAIAIMVLAVGSLMSLTYEQCRRYGNPIELYQATLLNNPDSWLAHINLGKTLKQSGRLPEAIDQFQQAIKLKSDDPNPFTNLGNALEQLGRFPEAIVQYQRALALKPDDPLAHNSLGVVLAETGQLQEAIEHYQHAVFCKPEFSEAHYNLGLALIRAALPQEALAHFQKVLQLEPSDTAAAMSIALTFAQLKRPEEAIAAAEKALSLAHRQEQTTEAQQIDGWLKSYAVGPRPPPN